MTESGGVEELLEVGVTGCSERRGEEAAELLGIPSSIMQVGLVPVAYTIGTDFKPAQRPPLDDITHWERW